MKSRLSKRKPQRIYSIQCTAGYSARLGKNNCLFKCVFLMKLLILTNVSLKETYSRDWIGIICLSYFLLEMV